MIDSQSVKITKSGGPRGLDAGKKINGRKGHIITDISGLLVGAIVHEADIRDRDGTAALLSSIQSVFPWLRHVFADGGMPGRSSGAQSSNLRNGCWKPSRDPMRQRASSCC